MVTDCLDAGALIKFAVDELTIHKAIGQGAVQLVFAEHELVGIELLCLARSLSWSAMNTILYSGSPL